MKTIVIQILDSGYVVVFPGVGAAESKHAFETVESLVDFVAEQIVAEREWGGERET